MDKISQKQPKKTRIVQNWQNKPRKDQNGQELLKAAGLNDPGIENQSKAQIYQGLHISLSTRDTKRPYRPQCQMKLLETDKNMQKWDESARMARKC